MVLPLDAAALRGRLARLANFYRTLGDARHHTVPGEHLVADVLALGEWPFPPLAGLTETPVLRPDGTVLAEPGYDRATRLVYTPAPGTQPPEVPARPGSQDIREAIRLLDDLTEDFPLVTECDRANLLGFMPTAIL